MLVQNGNDGLIALPCSPTFSRESTLGPHRRFFPYRLVQVVCDAVRIARKFSDACELAACRGKWHGHSRYNDLFLTSWFFEESV